MERFPARLLIAGGLIALLVGGVLLLPTNDEPGVTRPGHRLHHHGMATQASGSEEVAGPDAARRPATGFGPTARPAGTQDGPAWYQCVEGFEDRSDASSEDYSRVSACLQAAFRWEVLPWEVGELTCKLSSPRLRALVLREYIHSWDPSQVRGALDGFFLGCGRNLETFFVEPALVEIMERDPDWCAQLRQSLHPGDIFDRSTGLGGLLLAAFFARRGDKAAAQWIRDGACGLWGGSADQLSRSIDLSWELLPDPAGRLEFLTDAVLSPALPRGDKVGATLVLLLLDPAGWPGADPLPALDLADHLLSDERHNLSAAAQILASFGRRPPPDVPSSEFETLLARARTVAEHYGWTPPQ